MTVAPLGRRQHITAINSAVTSITTLTTSSSQMNRVERTAVLSGGTSSRSSPSSPTVQHKKIQTKRHRPLQAMQTERFVKLLTYLLTFLFTGVKLRDLRSPSLI